MLYVKQNAKPDTIRLRAYNNADYRKNSQLIRSMFGNYCAFHNRDCGDIHIHHNDRINTHNEITNLVPVCGNGHRIIHLSNWTFDNMKSLIVEKLQFMADSIKAGKSY